MAFEEVAKQLFVGRMSRTKSVISNQHLENMVTLESDNKNKGCCK
jgi:hypothetical protein